MTPFTPQAIHFADDGAIPNNPKLPLLFYAGAFAEVTPKLIEQTFAGNDWGDSWRASVFSLSNLFRASERKVEESCIHCNKCVEVCPFDAIKPDYTTRTADCTLCQTCGGVCPTHAIKFVERWNTTALKPVNDPPTGEGALGRRGFISWLAGGTAAVAGGVGLSALAKGWGHEGKPLPVRPPGSVPEQEFLQMCIRCGECFKACPNHVLQPMGFDQGLEGLWTPEVVADWAGCESSRNACGQVCPTGAIRALPLEEKKSTRMGLAIVN